MRWIILLLFLTACSSGPTLSFGDVSFNLDIADTQETREQGLMHVNSMSDSYGLLFVFEDDSIKTFWMKNTLIPLDMVFLDSDLRVVTIHTATPCTSEPCETYASSGPTRYVLEVNEGLSAKYGIEVGSTAILR